MSKRLKVEVGDVYNEFTVLEVIEDPKRRKVRVRCSCGNEELKALHPVYHGKAKYCERCSYVKRMKDITGERFGRLVCLSWEKFGGTRGDMSYWKCKCDCGNTAVVSIHFLKNASTPSCGCWSDENKSKFNLKHGMSNSLEYSTYQKVKQRCENPNNEEYENYGGRGIKCLFSSFDEFYEALGERPNNASIERHNVNDHYRVGNCYWETNWSVQAFNRRSNKVRKNKLPLGVFFRKSSNTYYAAVSKDGKRYARWGFRSIAEALEATKELELELFGFNRDRSNEEGVIYEEI